jgi:hypothetical protein
MKLPRVYTGLTVGILSLIAAASLAAPSCAAVPAITAAVVQEVQCVEAQIAAGTDTFEDIAIACGPMAVSDVVTIVADLATEAPDGSTSPVAAKAALVHHK